MTYEELLARIDNSDATNNGMGWKLLPIPAALRAVVELHYEKSFGEDSPIKNICDTCSKVYPCPTIQAIEKELA